MIRSITCVCIWLLLLVADAQKTLLISGTGDVIEPEDGVLAIGSGGPYAQSAARALIENTELDAEAIARKPASESTPSRVH